jgi:hypothetical protein
VQETIEAEKIVLRAGCVELSGLLPRCQAAA